MATEKDLERLRRTETINNNKKQQANNRIEKGFWDYVKDFVSVIVPVIAPAIIDGLVKFAQGLLDKDSKENEI